MATVKVSNTKNANRAINYAEKRATVADGFNCEVSNAKQEMAIVRGFYNKTDHIQAHLVIQSFSHEESQQLGAEKINQLGIELAEKVAPNHQVAVYTHTDKDHSHNHIVMNSVSHEDGQKYHKHHFFDHVKSLNDELAQKHNLNIVKQSSLERKSMAEIKLEQKGELPWKQKIRNTVDNAMQNRSVTSYGRFKAFLNDNGVNVSVRGKNVTYELLEGKNKVRGSKLGNDYQKEPLMKELDRRSLAHSGSSLSADANRIRANELKRAADRERKHLAEEERQQKLEDQDVLRLSRGLER